MTVANRKASTLLFCQQCFYTGESYSIDDVRVRDELKLSENSSMDCVKLHDELKIGLDVENNSMDGVKLHDVLKLGLDVKDKSKDYVRIYDELKLCLGVESFDKSPRQDSDESNLSYDGSEQHLFEALGRNSGERKELYKGLELEDGFDKEESSLTMLELAQDEEDEVNSSVSNWESQLCIPQDNLFDVFDTYPSFLDNRIPSTENLFSSAVDLNSRPKKSVNGTTLDNPIDVSETYKIKNYRDKLDFKVYTKRRSSKLMKRKRIIGVTMDFGRENNIYSAQKRQCSHCKVEKTPQWREGPLGPKTLCNACGVRYKKGRLVPEYRPLASPTFDPRKHSNRDRKIVKRMINPLM